MWFLRVSLVRVPFLICLGFLASYMTMFFRLQACRPTGSSLGVPCVSFVLRQSDVNCTVCMYDIDKCIVGQRDQGSMYVHVRNCRSKNLPTPRLDVVLPFVCTWSRTCLCFLLPGWDPESLPPLWRRCPSAPSLLSRCEVENPMRFKKNDLKKRRDEMIINLL